MKYFCGNILLLILLLYCINSTYSQPLSIVYPKNNFITSDSIISFEWNSIKTNPHRYDFQIATDSGFNKIYYEKQLHDSSFIEIKNLKKNTIFYWRIRGFVNNKYTSWTKFKIFRTFGPDFISGLELWYRADLGVVKDASNNVSIWQDMSGNARDGKQNTLSIMPAFKASSVPLNNKPVISFAKGNKANNQTYFDFLPVNFIDGNFTVILLYKINDLTDRGHPGNKWQYLIQGSGDAASNVIWARSHLVNGFAVQGGLGKITTSNLAYPDFQIFNIIKNKIYINSSEANYIQNYTISGNLNFSRLGTTISNSPTTQFFYGDLAEVIMYNQTLNDSLRLLADNYLRQKYTPPVNLGRDINVNYGFCKTTIDAGNRFKYFKWSTGETSQAISVNMSGSYTVEAWDVFGRKTTDTIIVTKTRLSLKDTSMCLSNSGVAEFKTGLEKKYYSFLWSDGTKEPSLFASKPGKYWVRITDTLGCKITDTVNIKIDSIASIVTLGPDKTMCSGEYIQLIKGAEKAVSYLWSNGKNDSIIPVKESGIYSLTVTSSTGCKGIDSIKVSINGIVPNSDFTADTVCLGHKTHFLDMSSVEQPYTLTNWKWDFGDSTISHNKNPEHIYKNPGRYKTTLTVASGIGCEKTISKYIEVNYLPDIDFLPTNGCSGIPVSFKDKSKDNYGNLITWKWDFGDKESIADTSATQNPVYAFNKEGIYTIKLTASSIIGCSDSIFKEINIKNTPESDFEYTDACLGNIIYFKDISKTPKYAPIYQWKWAFADTAVAYTSNPNFLFNKAATFYISLTVKSINGCSSTITKPVTVYAIPKAGFISKVLCVNSPYQFEDTSKVLNGNIDKWSWRFDKYGYSNIKNPYYTFQDTGNYYIRLTVKSNKGCTDSASRVISVKGLPKASFTFFPDFGAPPLRINFKNNSSGGEQWIWNFGDNHTSTDFEPVHTYEEKGIYNVRLTAHNKYGCMDSDSDKIYVMNLINDIAVTKIYAEIKNNYIEYSADLINMGSSIIKLIDFDVFLNGNIHIKESWAGILYPGAELNYKFASKFETIPNKNPEYLCVFADLSNDNNISDNEKCFMFVKDFTAFEPYPNPLSDILNIDFNLPYSDNTEIELYNSKGQSIGEIYSGTSKNGLNHLTLNISTLSAGMYTYKITFRNDYKVRKFIKL